MSREIEDLLIERDQLEDRISDIDREIERLEEELETDTLDPYEDRGISPYDFI